jgi:hypothetical protein
VAGVAGGHVHPINRADVGETPDDRRAVGHESSRGCCASTSRFD